ncbi:MAG TPA: PHP domain-containing protein [Clostridiales bacterium]|nr:PHP domain-containing protein [Clostridiales bacterium]
MNTVIGQGKADLHNHTTASDGLLSPAQLVRFAAIKGLKAIAITDHDTTEGIDEGLRAGQFYKIKVIPGIELNTQLDSVEIHLLGYFINWNSEYLQKILFKMRDIRKNRAKKMVEKLVNLYGFDISYEEVLKEAKEGAVARPHIARVLISKGIVKDMSEAFEKYIGTDCPAYVGRYHLTPKEGIELIEICGGVPVLAHPGLITVPGIAEMMLDQGIKGIEAYHSKHTQEQAEYYSELAKKSGLLITGGTDCHGELFDGMPIIGDVSVGMDAVEELKHLSRQK